MDIFLKTFIQMQNPSRVYKKGNIMVCYTVEIYTYVPEQEMKYSLSSQGK